MRSDPRPALRIADLHRLAALLEAADHVLVGAGAGLSVDAGIDYGDPRWFARHFPAMAARGYRTCYQLFGETEWSEALKWGYLAAQVDLVRWRTPAHAVYQRLHSLVREKDHFVITSNADGQFEKSGFSVERLFTPQGSYALSQCLRPCSKETWPTRPILDRILPAIDPATQEVTDPRVIPKCPRCGGPMFLNVRGGRWFIEEPHAAQAERFDAWLARATGRLLVLEFGAGFNTPGVIRWPMERTVRSHPRAHLVRVNVDHPEIQTPLGERATSLPCRASEVIDALVALPSLSTAAATRSCADAR